MPFTHKRNYISSFWYSSYLSTFHTPSRYQAAVRKWISSATGYMRMISVSTHASQEFSSDAINTKREGDCHCASELVSIDRKTHFDRQNCTFGVSTFPLDQDVVDCSPYQTSILCLGIPHGAVRVERSSMHPSQGCPCTIRRDGDRVISAWRKHKGVDMPFSTQLVHSYQILNF